MEEMRIGGREEEEEEEEEEATVYKTYKRRFAIILTIYLLNLSLNGIGFNMASVSYKAADYFRVTPAAITWFTQLYLILPIIFSSASTFISNKYDLKLVIHIGALLTCVGGVIRALATSGMLADAHTQFAISLFGQAFAAIGPLFTGFSVTKIAQNWFPDNERIAATTLLSFSQQLGISTAHVISPLIVWRQQQVPVLNYGYAGLAVLAELVTIVCVTRSRPPSPPSPSSAAKETHGSAPFLQQVRAAFTCPAFLCLVVVNMASSGLFLLLSTVSQQMLCSVGYSDLFSGLVVTSFIIGILTGSLLIAVAVSALKAMTPVIKLSYGVSGLFVIAMMELYIVPNQHVLLLVSSFLSGCLSGGAFPLTLEMGVEATYPVEETLSTTVIFVTGQVSSSLGIYATTHLSATLPPELQQVQVCTKGITSDLEARDYSSIVTGIMAVYSLIVVLFILLFHTPYKRQMTGRTLG